MAIVLVDTSAWLFNFELLRGVKAKTVDFLIAYKAMRHRLVLIHADRDFDRIARFVPLREGDASFGTPILPGATFSPYKVI